MIRRGEIYFVELGPTRGHEIDEKTRPVVVLSINDINDRLVVTVIPGTTTPPDRDFKNIVRLLPTRANGLSETTYFRAEQIRALDPGRFRTPVGRVTAQDLGKIEVAVRFCLGLF